MKRVTACFALTFALGPPLWAQARLLKPAVVDNVLLYSTQANVSKLAMVEIADSGANDVAITTLPTGADADSVQVHCDSAEVVRVAIVKRPPPLAPADPNTRSAKALISALETVQDKLTNLWDEEKILKDELQYVRSLNLSQPEASLPSSQVRPNEGIYLTAWNAILDWSQSREQSLNSGLETVLATRRKLHKELWALQVEASAFNLSDTNRLVRWVEVTLKGKGKHQIKVSYLVHGVRWLPSYDLRYNPKDRTADATYYAVVQQRSGEIWSDASLKFSTALPLRLIAVPELMTEVVGRKRDFTPTTRQRREPPQRRWYAATPDPAVEPLKARLAALVGEKGKRAAEKRREYEFDDGIVDGDLEKKKWKRRPPRYFKAKPAPKMDYRRDPSEGAADEELATEPVPPPPARPAAMSVRAENASSSSYRTTSRYPGGSAPSVPTVSLPWTATGYRPPVLDPRLPAAAAQGFRFELHAPGKYSIRDEGKEYRIPLLTRRLAVKPLYRIIPGMSKAAYLVAEVKNTTGHPILRGEANLYSGNMYRGHSKLKTALPGHTIELPLGVDDAVKVARQMRQRTLEKGVVFKDDVSAYTVEIEIANHHQEAVDVHLTDHLPLAIGEKVKVREFSSNAGMAAPDDKGMVHWKGKVAASSVKKLRFNYQIVRPKNWKLRQHDG